MIDLNGGWKDHPHLFVSNHHPLLDVRCCAQLKRCIISPEGGQNDCK